MDFLESIKNVVHNELQKLSNLKPVIVSEIAQLIENHDESKIYIYQLTWRYPGTPLDYDAKTIDKIAYETGVLYSKLFQELRKDRKILWSHHDNLGYEHHIFLTDKDQLETLIINANDETIKVILLLASDSGKTNREYL